MGTRPSANESFKILSEGALRCWSREFRPAASWHYVTVTKLALPSGAERVGADGSSSSAGGAPPRIALGRRARSPRGRQGAGPRGAHGACRRTRARSRAAPDGTPPGHPSSPRPRREPETEGARRRVGVSHLPSRSGPRRRAGGTIVGSSGPAGQDRLVAAVPRTTHRRVGHHSSRDDNEPAQSFAVKCPPPLRASRPSPIERHPG